MLRENGTEAQLPSSSCRSPGSFLDHSTGFQTPDFEPIKQEDHRDPRERLLAAAQIKTVIGKEDWSFFAVRSGKDEVYPFLAFRRKWILAAASGAL